MKTIYLFILLITSTSIFAQYTYVPDDNFEQRLIHKGYDDILDNYVLTANISGITNIGLGSSGISDLTGIEDFVSLEVLDFSLNNLQTVDLSSNTALEHVHCYQNQLISLDLSSNPAIEEINCWDNNITSLDLSSNPALKSLGCWDNELVTLNLSENNVLRGLYCHSNNLKSLDLSANPNMVGLNCSNNQIDTLILTNNINLEDFYCSSNQLKLLDLRNGNNAGILNFNSTNNPELYCLYVDDKNAGYLDYWEKDTWTEFVETENECNDTYYTYIPDDNFEQALIDLGYDDIMDDYVYRPNIIPVDSLDISNKNISDLTGIEDFTTLQFLNCCSNQLTSIDLSSNTAIEWLDCNSNQLTNLDLSSNFNLTHVICYSNQLTDIDIRNGENDIITFFCSVSNPLLRCIYVDDKNAWYFDYYWHIDTWSEYVETAQECALIDYTNVPDDNFEQALIDLGYDDILDDYVFTSNIEGITSLDINNKNIRVLTGIEDFVSLQELYCRNNHIDNMDISSNTALIILECHANYLTSLDLSSNSALEVLNCENNLLTNIDLRNGNNSNIASFSSLNNSYLICIYVDNKNAVYLTTWNKDPWSNFVENDNECDAMSPYTYVPDNNFEKCLIDKGYDDILDDYVLTNNINNISRLYCSSEWIADLTGIEDFTSLKELGLYRNHLTSLDLSSNILLEILSCSTNQLISLNISSNKFLRSLECYNNNLTVLDVSSNQELTTLICQNNLLTDIDVSSNPCLQELYCSSNGLNSVDVSSNLDLTELACADNYLTSLDISANIALKYLNCRSNQLTSIDVSSNTALQSLICYSNQLSNLDISSCTDLRFLKCPNNQLSNLDLSQNKKLWYINCSYNQLTSLDVTMCPDLDELWCNGNQISSLDLSSNPELFCFMCHNNQITGLDLRANPELMYFTCHDNQLSYLDIRNGTSDDILYYKSFNNPDLYCIYVDNRTFNKGPHDPWSFFVESEEECAQNTYIPDDNFEYELIDLGYDYFVDDSVLTANIIDIPDLDIGNKEIYDLTGIEDFLNLRRLNCNSNALSGIDLSSNILLRNLDCSNNLLTTLDISSNTGLLYLNCDYNQLTGLDLSSNINLFDLNFSYNQLPGIDLSVNTDLSTICCAGNKLNSLDLSTNKDLKYLNCNRNELTGLDLSPNINLQYLDCEDNNLLSLDLPFNYTFLTLKCGNNKLTDLDLFFYESLLFIDCHSNQLSDLDLSTNHRLTNLYCHNNQLVSLDIRNNNNAEIENFESYDNPDLICIYVDDTNAPYLNYWEIDPWSHFVKTEEECEALEIKDVTKTSHFIIFPNPAKEYFCIQIEGQIISVKVYDVFGELVQQYNSQEYYSISSFQSGMYYIHIETDNETIIKKIIKN